MVVFPFRGSGSKPIIYLLLLYCFIELFIYDGLFSLYLNFVLFLILNSLSSRLNLTSSSRLRYFYSVGAEIRGFYILALELLRLLDLGLLDLGIPF